MMNEKYECEIVDMIQHFHLHAKGDGGLGDNFNFTETEFFDINQVDTRKKTILHLACQAGDVGVVRALVY
jgi:ankyrin repeat protein